MKNMTGDAPLDQISVHSFLNGFEFRDLVLEKINDLDSNNASHRQLEGLVRALLEMVEESRGGRYPGLSLGLFARILLELDHFIKIDDTAPDTRVDGYLDDLARIQDLFGVHDEHFEAFLKWRQAQVAA